ncbi:MAG: transposase [Ignavibacteria bacterium]|nr:transposase [Ignavibacteria bacterium]
MKERKSPRLKEYDYSIPNYYFVTICADGKLNFFGNVTGESVELNKNGIIVKECLLGTKEHFTNVEIDEYVIMPNHFHAIIILSGYVGLRSPQPNVKTESFSLSQIVAYFKYQSTKRINAGSNTKEKIWQRSFYDRIIRNEMELYNIRKYIQQNPLKKHLEIVANMDL